MNFARPTVLVLAFSSFALAGIRAPLGAAELSVGVGGAAMVASRSFVENFAGSKDHRTFVEGLAAADLAELMGGEGPFTVFAPTDKAFAGLPKGTVAALLAPESKARLEALLAYHVVPGRFSAADLVHAADKASGKAALQTLQGGTLIVTHDGRRLEIVDAAGGKAVVTIPDVNQRNGIAHVVDAVLQPGE